MAEQAHYDLAVVGGGSAGVAAALAAARQGLRVVIIERGQMLGGTATLGGVNAWAPGVGGTGIPFDLYGRLRRDHPEAVGISTIGRHFCEQPRQFWPDRPELVNFPGGESVIDPARRYLDTLRRHPEPGLAGPALWRWKRQHWHEVVFLPEAMAAVQAAMLADTGRVTVHLGTPCGPASVDAGRVHSVVFPNGERLSADYWVDAAGGVFCHALGCETLRGVDPRHRFGEPGAPRRAADHVNAVSLVYRVTPADSPLVEPLPADIPERCWWAAHFPPMSCSQYPDGSRNCNMLPTMEGTERIQLGYQAAYRECSDRVRAHWHFVQTHWPEFRHYRLTWLAPLLGIRESRRVLCHKMLTEKHLRLGLDCQPDPDIIALADHALDRHGAGGGCEEVAEPYGIPYRCLVPRGWRNLLVAGRAAGFSSIAASSCRLTRTMMQLGQAAGTAVAIAHAARQDVIAVPADDLRARLRDQHVQLEWPATAAIADHLLAETRH